MAMRRLIKNTNAGVGVIFALLLGTGSLLAVLALGYDFGRVYFEQQTLRNAASASAHALATACATQSTVCTDQASAEAFVQDFLNANSPDGDTALEELCGDVPLQACAALETVPTDCAAYEGTESLVRVTVASSQNQQVGFELLFTEQDQVDLWQCAQAQWGSDLVSVVELETMFDLGFPLCDYPGDQSEVVWFKFQNSGATPDIPREASCNLEIDGESYEFIDVANGAAGLDLPVASCTSSVVIDTQDIISFGESNWKKLCSSDVGDFLDDAIANELDISVALIGNFVRQSTANIDFEVAGNATIRVLGYIIANNLAGGQVPPGGWASYPPTAPANETCANNRPCIYGYYSSDLAIETVDTQARLVHK